LDTPSYMHEYAQWNDAHVLNLYSNSCDARSELNVKPRCLFYKPYYSCLQIRYSSII